MRSELELQLMKSLRINDAIRDVKKELERAIMLFPAFHSAHEGKAVIEEEYDELWDEIKLKERNMRAMRDEAVQLAAMALRFIVEVCDS